MKLYLIFAISLISLISCTDNLIRDENSFTYSIPVGSLLTLNQRVTIASNHGRIYFQNGKTTNENKINIYYPHCSLTVNTILQKEHAIHPSTFEITKIIDDEEYAQGYMLFASSDIHLGSPGPLITGLVTYYHLKSLTEPDVRTLECIQWNSLYENKHLSITDIRKSLGDIFTLKINQK